MLGKVTVDRICNGFWRTCLHAASVSDYCWTAGVSFHHQFG